MALAFRPNAQHPHDFDHGDVAHRSIGGSCQSQGRARALSDQADKPDCSQRMGQGAKPSGASRDRRSLPKHHMVDTSGSGAL